MIPPKQTYTVMWQLNVGNATVGRRLELVTEGETVKVVVDG
jgi:hypothetical protein